jgi:hypothetical protein
MCSLGIDASRERWHDISMVRLSLGWWGLGPVGMLRAVAVATGALNCSSNGGSGSDSAPVVIGDVCPLCEPRLGGESSDFEGDLPVCFGFMQRRPVTDEQAQALGFDIASIRSRVEREFSAPLRWSEDEPRPLDSSPPASMPPSGFLPEASIHGVVTAASEMVVAELDPELCDAAGNCQLSLPPEVVACADDARSFVSTLELTLEIGTSDQAIESATLSGVTRLVKGETPSVVFGEFDGDLTLVQGALRIGATEPHFGRLGATLGFWPTAVRGQLTPEVFSEEPDARVTYTVPDDTPFSPSWRYAPLTGLWPGDGCYHAAVPIDEPSAEGQAALDRIAADHPVAEARVNGTPPLDGGWDAIPAPDPIAPVLIGVQLVGDARPSCAEADGTPHLEVDVHVSSSDGRLDWTFPARGELRRRPNEAPSLALYRTEQFASDAAFWSENLRGADLLGSVAAEVQFNVAYSLDDDSDAVQGQLEVRAIPDCARDYRCAGPRAPSAPQCGECGTSTPVVQLFWGR